MFKPIVDILFLSNGFIFSIESITVNGLLVYKFNIVKLEEFYAYK